MKKRAVITLLLLTGCAPNVPMRDMGAMDQGDQRRAMQVRVYTVDSGSIYPEVSEYLGDVQAYSCQFMMTDPPASKGDALKRLRYEAVQKGANGIIDVTFDDRGTDLGTNCWESVQANGVAVKFGER